MLLAHRIEENPDYIEYTSSLMSKKYAVSSMKDDKELYHTSDLDTWLRSMAIGYNIDGEPRYDIFLLIGRYLDTTLVRFLGMIQNKPVYCLTDGMAIPLNKLKVIQEDNSTYRLGDTNE